MRTGLNLLKVAVALAVAVSVSNAMAQGGKGGGRGGRGGGVNPITLVKVEGVQKDLELSQDQKDKVAKLEATQIDFQSLANLSQEERRAKMAESRAADQKKVNEILLPPQVERLQEIAIQLDGVRALTRPEVQTKLKITDDQKTKIDEALANAGGGGKGKGGFGRISPEVEAQVIDVLTADQKSQYTAMQGKKTEVTMQDVMAAGGFGGGKGNFGNKGNRKGGNKGAPDA